MGNRFFFTLILKRLIFPHELTWFGYVFDVVAESSVQSSTCTLWVHFEAGYKHEQWDEFIVK